MNIPIAKFYTYFPILPAVVLALGLLTGATSCKKEQAPSASKVDSLYSLPQGNHPFDKDIISYFDRYNTYFLYQFSKNDFGWTPTVPGSNTNGFGSSYTCVQADVDYVGKLLPFVYNNWLGLYPDSVLKRTLPIKVLLGKTITQVSNGKLLSTITGYNHITIANGSAVLDTMTDATKLKFRQDIHGEYWNWMLVNGRMPIPATFTALSNYTQTGITTATMYQYGFLSVMVPSNASKYITDQIDFIRVIISNTRAQLDATILSPAVDTKGLILKKYNALTAYFKTNYHIDLQQMGETGLVP